MFTTASEWTGSLTTIVLMGMAALMAFAATI